MTGAETTNTAEIVEDGGRVSIDVSGGLPLCVDCDGTLIRTDLLFEHIARLFRIAPWKVFLLPVWLVKGRSHLKEKLASAAPINVTTLPYHSELLSYLRRQRASGRTLALASASNERTIGAIAEHLNLFDSIHASDGRTNLKSHTKARRLAETFPRGFAYAGDSAADLAVWRVAAASLPVGKIANRAGSLAPIEARFFNQKVGLKTIAEAARVHQWSKNTLIFLPLLLGRAFSWHAILTCLAAFLVFSLLASATYLLNDLLDLESDRIHKAKRYRALAAGNLPILAALLVIPAIYAAGLSLAFWFGAKFGLAVAGYLVLTSCYSFLFKAVPVLDVLCLGALYTVRIYMGIVLLSQAVSPWLMMFSISFFTSLSFVKRCVELVKARSNGIDRLPGRSYGEKDFQFIVGFGIATGLLSLIVFILYLVNDQYPATIYSRPDWLWLVPLPLFYWNAHMWLTSIRGEMADDPIVFALRDRASWIALGLMIAAIMLAY